MTGDKIVVDFSDALSSAATVQVQAHRDPIADATYNLHQPTQEKFDRLKARWPEPVNMELADTLELFNFKPLHPLKNYSTADFQVFLPPSPVDIGDVWDIDSEEILPFLRQFHLGVTTELRYYSKKRERQVRKGTNGAKACLKAISPEHIEIAFRIHALFMLDGPEALFMPAQFAGHLVINRNTRRLYKFSLSLPSRNSNVDINAFGVADIVFVPHMELSALSDAPIHEIAWETTITEEETRKKLATAFYKFAEIEWTPIEDVVELAKGTNRPIHALVLFGTLDDESC
ncbi:MAG: hypothetical protein OXH00_07675 [Candidatus Poribacteria bacterium]|nr:hypothetical protein [Candidatus Poribacteria bacterium]